MRLTFTSGILIVAVSGACFGQTAERNRRGDDEFEIPLPIVSPRAVPPAFVPLTSKEKAALAFRNTFYPRAVANRMIWASFDHLLDDPSEWSDSGEGYGIRIGHRMGSLAVRQAIELGGNTLLRTDPRYDVCECTSFWGRTRHAWRRVVSTRKDSGGETVAIARLAGDLGTPWVTHMWMPDRYDTTGSKLESGLFRFGLRGATNMLREFWPDIARKSRIPAPFAPRDGR